MVTSILFNLLVAALEIYLRRPVLRFLIVYFETLDRCARRVCAASNNLVIRARLQLARLSTLRQNTARRLGNVALSARRSSTHRMIDRILGHTAASRTTSEHVPVTSCLADMHVLMIQITNLSNGRAAFRRHKPHFA